MDVLLICPHCSVLLSCWFADRYPRTDRVPRGSCGARGPWGGGLPGAPRRGASRSAERLLGARRLGGGDLRAVIAAAPRAGQSRTSHGGLAVMRVRGDVTGAVAV